MGVNPLNWDNPNFFKINFNLLVKKRKEIEQKKGDFSFNLP